MVSNFSKLARERVALKTICVGDKTPGRLTYANKASGSPSSVERQ